MRKMLSRAVCAGLAIAIALPLAARADSPDGDHMMWGGGMGGFLGPVMMLVMIVLVAVVIALVWRAINPGKTLSSGPESALTILRERYAKGEIDKTEFDERRRVLEG